MVKDIEELNKKLAEWARFRAITSEGWEGYYKAPKGVQVYWSVCKPNFIDSLDACFKWLMPLAISQICHLFKVSIDIAYKTLFQWWLEERLKINDIDIDALALCKVIEKLIDSEEVKQ